MICDHLHCHNEATHIVKIPTNKLPVMMRFCEEHADRAVTNFSATKHPLLHVESGEAS